MTPSGIVSTDYRIEPVVYSGALVDGVSSVVVPTSISKSGTTYTVTATKTLTYYSTDYVLEHPSVASEATITDPALVAAYYIAFKAAPANYLIYDTKEKQAERKTGDDSVFGFSNLRCVSEYSRTDGYAKSVPWKDNPNKSGQAPLYHELDVKLPGQYYSINSRGAGRVVAWDYGFECYGNYATATYTDDHYATFHEYLNYGSFGTAFVGEES